MKFVKDFFEILTPRERRRLYLLFVAVLVMAGLEVVSVASIMPFLSVAADPASIHENLYLNWAFQTFEFTERNTFLVSLGFAALTALLVSNSFIVFTTWALFRYAWNRNHTISVRLLNSYLTKPYGYFITRNSSRLGKNILEEVREVVNGMLVPALLGTAKATVALFIVGFLFYIDPIISITAVLVLGSSYAGIYFFERDRIESYGEERVKENTKRYKCVSEVFGGIKEVKLRSKEGSFLSRYISPSKRYSRYQARFRVIKRIPRYILEAVAFGGIILIAVYLIAFQSSTQQVIPVLGLYAFAGYRLMPALQQAFRGIASAHFNRAALKSLRRGLENQNEVLLQPDRDSSRNSEADVITLNNRLVIDDVYFTYPGASEPAIEGISLEIPARSTVGFVGKTGSGKTTTVDLILGLLRPQKGLISVDGTPLDDDSIPRWQRDIGYVPQQIYLSDDTVARNIAFGVSEEKIDMEAVKDAAYRAHIYDFVSSELPNRWETVVGERGVKLSGGQRQRIGIARALYHNPSVLVFDEATSALDQSTESSVMEAIYELENDHTLLMIAHRLSTVRRADNIIMLEDGTKVGEGTFEELRQKSSTFRDMSRTK